mmetsp:Transcript_79396/g.233269  ORF Transcript_79396/g.233269 Transcript_79396/m.233269 type:complete len:235 (-) Transcript_79396:247-951(-)
MLRKAPPSPWPSPRTATPWSPAPGAASSKSGTWAPGSACTRFGPPGAGRRRGTWTWSSRVFAQWPSRRTCTPSAPCLSTRLTTCGSCASGMWRAAIARGPAKAASGASARRRLRPMAGPWRRPPWTATSASGRPAPWPVGRKSRQNPTCASGPSACQPRRWPTHRMAVQFCARLWMAWPRSSRQAAASACARCSSSSPSAAEAPSSSTSRHPSLRTASPRWPAAPALAHSCGTS